jgi:hypothetical protein
MSTIINGNFQDANAAKRALSDLSIAGVAPEQSATFSVSLPKPTADTALLPWTTVTGSVSTMSEQ